MGLSRSFGAFLTGNLVEPLVRLGEWAEAERLAAGGAGTGLTGVFAASLHELLGYMAVCRGRSTTRCDHVRQARRQLGDSREPQFTQALAYIEADAARGARRSEPTPTRWSPAALDETTAWSARYAWPLVWLGARIAADAPLRARDRHGAGGRRATPARTRTRCRAPSVTASPAAAAYRAMTAAEDVRRGGEPAARAWAEAVGAWEVAGDVWPTAYARYRLAEALMRRGRPSARPAEPLRAAARRRPAAGCAAAARRRAGAGAAGPDRRRTTARRPRRRAGRCPSG